MKARTATAATAMAARCLSGQSVLAMPKTACATIATATIFRPCSAPTPTGPSMRAAVIAKTRSASAEGKVKAKKAASAPSQPARSIPSAKPT